MRKKFAPLWLAIIIDSMGFGLVYPVLTAIFTSEVHPILSPGTSEALRNFYLGLGFLLYPLFMFFGSSFLGDLSDSFGRKKILIVSMIGLFASYALMGLGIELNVLWLLFAGRALSGTFAGCQPIAQASVADMSHPDEKGRNMNLMGFVYSFGIVLGPIIGGVFADRKIFFLFTFSTPFYFAGILAIFNALWLLKGFEETYQPVQEKKIDLTRPVRIFFEAFAHRRVFFIASIFFLMQLGYATFYQIIQIYMRVQYSYSTFQLGLFNALIGVSFVLATFLSYKFAAAHIKAEKLALFTLLGAGLGLVLVAFSPNQGLLLTFSFIASGLDMVAYATMIACFSRAVGPDAQGWVMGIFGALLAISWVLTGLSTNLIPSLKFFGLFLCSGILMILSWLFMIRYAKKYPAHAQ